MSIKTIHFQYKINEAYVVDAPVGGNPSVGIGCYSDHIIVGIGEEDMAYVDGENLEGISADDILLPDTSETGFAYENLVAGAS